MHLQRSTNAEATCTKASHGRQQECALKRDARFCFRYLCGMVTPCAPHIGGSADSQVKSDSVENMCP